MEKKERLETIAMQKSPVKIRKFNVSRKYGTDDVVIGKNTVITPTTVNFDYQSIETKITVGG